MKKILVIVLMLGGLMLMLQSCSRSKEISIDTEKSYYSSFYVVDDNVYIKCKVLIRNDSEETKSFYLFANFSKDVRGGLLKSAKLYATDNDGNKEVFTVPAKTEQEFEITFFGDFAGKEQKHDRLLPNIKIEILLESQM